MGNYLFVLAIVIAISVIVDWISLLALKKSMNSISSLLIAFCIYFMWVVIATGGIIR